MILIKFIVSIFDFLRRAYCKYISPIFYTSRLGYCGKQVNFRNRNPHPTEFLSRMYLYDNVAIAGFHLISDGGKFIMKKNSGAASGLTIVTGNHGRSVGQPFRSKGKTNLSQDIEKDVIVEEDVWLGQNVTLLSGVIIGRGSTVGACSTCLKSVPPYSIVMGNPAKVVGFNFTPEEIIEHEKALYPEEERLPLELLEKNYNKYFISRIKEIKEFTRLSL